MSTKPTLPSPASLPLPKVWFAFLAALLAYTAALEARLEKLED